MPALTGLRSLDVFGDDRSAATPHTLTVREQGLPADNHLAAIREPLCLGRAVQY